jgi:hypothetical protein
MTLRKVVIFSKSIPIGSMAHSASYYMGTGDPSPGGKVAGALRWSRTFI